MMTTPSRFMFQALCKWYKDQVDRNLIELQLLILDAKEKKSQTSKAIHQLALDGLLYLDTRTDFWRQQKPMYARKRDRYMQQARMSKKGNDPVKFTLKKLKAIDEGTRKLGT